MSRTTIRFDERDELYFPEPQRMRLWISVAWEHAGEERRIDWDNIVPSGAEIKLGSKWIPLPGYAFDVFEAWLEAPDNRDRLREYVNATEDQHATAPRLPVDGFDGVHCDQGQSH